MARQVKYVVRVVLFEHQLRGDEGALIECFRYAGLVSHPREGDGTTLTFDIYPPHEAPTKAWADMNAERMRTFGFNAEAAPTVN